MPRTACLLDENSVRLGVQQIPTSMVTGPIRHLVITHGLLLDNIVCRTLGLVPTDSWRGRQQGVRVFVDWTAKLLGFGTAAKVRE